ncbi:MAG: menaquinone-specific isochorismate synthase [Thermoleophilaceae bacterium]|nr:menaquinone-specific isochorismate synthase [Thermoleophilaceae bacterium]
MRTEVVAGEGPLRFDARARDRLEDRIGSASALARRGGRPVVASASCAIDPSVDLAAAVLAARRPGDRFFCFGQPDRDGFALAGLGEAAAVTASGTGRFKDAAEECRRVGLGALFDDVDVPAAGPVWVGGFAFADAGAAAPEWSSLPSALLTLPEVSLARRGDAAWLTASVLVQGDEAPGALMERLEARLAELRPARMPLLDPDPVAAARVAGAAPPEHFESAVARATERKAAGGGGTVVLAREVRVHMPRPAEPGAVYDALRAGFPSCYCYLVGTPELVFIGASPELLVRRDGQRAQTVALAGTRRRSADPSVDRHLAEQLLQSPKDREEQAIVGRRIERALRPVSVWVAAAEEPVVVKVQNVQHLGTPIRAQLAEPVACVELAGLLHPTPAVGGEPRDVALRLIPALEGLDRGWYAGPVGWTDLAEDGEFCVALRCALLRGDVAHLYAGEGIVRDSVPSEELEANEAKLQALLPLLT